MNALRDLFLAPGPAVQADERMAPVALGVLVASAEAGVAGASVGLAAARAAGAPCALVCRWTGIEEQPGSSSLAVPAARRLCGRLTTRGLAAAARGRLVTVVLPASDTLARAAAERAMAAADVPTVLVIAGPRSAAFDPLLADLDRLVVVPPRDAPSGLAPLALDAAALLGRSTSVLHLPPATAAAQRLTIASGLALSPALRTAAHAALEGHGHA